jgi:hypothetical protein
LHPVTAAWVEDQTTWNDRDKENTIAWSTAGGDYNAAVSQTFSSGTTNVYINIDVLTLFEDMRSSNSFDIINKLQTESSTTQTLQISPFGSVNSPTLTITYTPQPQINIFDALSPLSRTHYFLPDRSATDFDYDLCEAITRVTTGIAVHYHDDDDIQLALDAQAATGCKIALMVEDGLIFDEDILNAESSEYSTHTYGTGANAGGQPSLTFPVNAISGDIVNNEVELTFTWDGGTDNDHWWVYLGTEAPADPEADGSSFDLGNSDDLIINEYTATVPVGTTFYMTIFYVIGASWSDYKAVRYEITIQPAQFHYPVTVDTGEATWIYSINPDEVQGVPGSAFPLERDLHSRLNERRTLLRFSLDDIPVGATVQSATLQLYQVFSGSFSHSIKRIGEDWVAGEATWNSRNSTSSWSTAGGTFIDNPNVTFTTGSTSNTMLPEIDITSLVLAAIDDEDTELNIAIIGLGANNAFGSFETHYPPNLRLNFAYELPNNSRAKTFYDRLVDLRDNQQLITPIIVFRNETDTDKELTVASWYAAAKQAYPTAGVTWYRFPGWQMTSVNMGYSDIYQFFDPPRDYNMATIFGEDAADASWTRGQNKDYSYHEYVIWLSMGFYKSQYISTTGSNWVFQLGGRSKYIWNRMAYHLFVHSAGSYIKTTSFRKYYHAIFILDSFFSEYPIADAISDFQYYYRGWLNSHVDGIINPDSRAVILIAPDVTIS